MQGKVRWAVDGDNVRQYTLYVLGMKAKLTSSSRMNFFVAVIFIR
jgi:hypothetical protein